jgi:hypothetical protein
MAVPISFDQTPSPPFHSTRHILLLSFFFKVGIHHKPEMATHLANEETTEKKMRNNFSIDKTRSKKERKKTIQ